MMNQILRHTLQGSVIGLVLFVGVGLLFAIPNPVSDAAGEYIPLRITQSVEESLALPLAEPPQVQVADARTEPVASDAMAPAAVPAAVEPTPAAVEQAAQGAAVEPASDPATVADPPAPVPADAAVRPVAINPGGVVSGVVTMFPPTAAAVDPATGAPLPIPAATGGGPAAGFAVTFFQNGQVVAQTTTDAAGNFQVSGLAPGTYSVVVSRDACASAYTVDVQAAGAAGTPGQLLIGVGPCEEYAQAVAAEEPFGMMGGAMGGGMMGGGGGGGGEMGGLGSMLGLAGLAGLAGLSGDDDESRIITEQIQASPYSP